MNMNFPAGRPFRCSHVHTGACNASLWEDPRDCWGDEDDLEDEYERAEYDVNTDPYYGQN